jgi:hypothetical protein
MGDFNKKKKTGVFPSKKKLKNRHLYCFAHAVLANLMVILWAVFWGINKLMAY